jgi:serine/threonine-protein kinase
LTATEEIAKGATLAGRYRVLRRLGSGGMATVFLAEDERLGRRVAVKRLHTDAPKASLRRFRNEARLGAALNHPSFVAVYDTAVTDEGALIVMEWVDGTSLAELSGGRRMRPQRALPILRAVADALDHAHSQGVVHRDVKPGNILVGDEDVVKLADLGIARAVGATQITSEGSVVGTLPYMSPERLAGPGSGGPESDVYALAAVAYELLSGRPPKEPTSSEQAQVAPPPDLRRDWPAAPEAAAAVLERGLDPDPARRQPSAGLLVDELEAALGGAKTTRRRAAAAAAVTPPPRRLGTGPRSAARVPGRGGLREWARRTPGLAVAAAVVAALLLAGGVMALTGGDEGGGDDTTPAGDESSDAAKAEKQKAAEPAPAPAPESASVESDPRSPAELNDLGFSLSNQGRYEEAIPILQRAVDAYPAGSDELTYAFALFNLGHALRMAGRPEEAIPVLERRLEIPNQTGEVQRELEAAYAAAGLEGSGGEGGEEGPGNGNGKAKGHEKDD